MKGSVMTESISEVSRYLASLFRSASSLRAGVVSIVALGSSITLGCASSSQLTNSDVPRVLDPDLARLERIYRAREDSIRMVVNDADANFMSGMIHHHAQALVMSALAPTHSSNSAIKTLTSRIINAQKDEIAVMQRWLGERGRPVPEVDTSGTMTMSQDHSMHMPGMLSPQQIDSLTLAHNEEYDRLFLRYMIQHHNGAVGMVHDLFATDGAAQDDFVFKLASDIQVDQITEVARMQKMLDEFMRASPNR
tara:strand:+ start:451 stop:1203 length:753 start_codon:yes stop_codon:yes gene_type:complete